MQKGKSLVEIANELARQQTSKVDALVATHMLQMEGENILLPATVNSGNLATVRPLTALAHRQLGSHLNIPAAYYDRMREQAPDLLADNVNGWFARAEPQDRRMVRMLDGRVRAFLSDRYQRIDNYDVANAVLPILRDIPGLEIASVEVTESRLYIQATTARVAGEVTVGDVVQAGILVKNSEVGLGAFSVEQLVYRLRCLNGMVLPDGRFRKHHVGANAKTDDSIYALLSDETRRLDDAAIMAKARDVVRAAFDDSRFRMALNRMKEAADPATKLAGNPARAVEILGQRIGLTQGEQGDMLRNLIEGGDLSRWGMVNAVTALAHTARDYDRAVDLESLGGMVLELPANEYRVIQQAA